MPQFSSSLEAGGAGIQCHFSESPGLMSPAVCPSPATVCIIPGSALPQVQFTELWALMAGGAHGPSCSAPCILPVISKGTFFMASAIPSGSARTGTHIPPHLPAGGAQHRACHKVQSFTLEPQAEESSRALPAPPASSPVVCGGGTVHICVHICTRGCCLHARPSGGVQTHVHEGVCLCTAPCLKETSCKPTAQVGATSP